MRTAIIAGGRGTRIAEHYPDIPKPMISVDGKPLLQYQVELLVSQGFTEITLLLGYKAEIISDYFGDGSKFGASINYITEETPLDTGGALALLPKETILIMLGDLYCNIDLNRFIAFHEKSQADVTLFVHPNNHPQDSDIIKVDDDSRVTGWFSKKDRQDAELRNLVNAGIYVMSADVLPEGVAIKRNLNRDIIIPAIRDGKVFAYRSSEYVKDIGTLSRLRQVENDINSGVDVARSLKNRQKAIFLDRDGTINVFDGFIVKPEQIRLVNDAAQAIREINSSEYLVICVTNQPVIARGDVTFEELDAIHAKLDSLLGEQGAYLDDLFFCPHHPDKGFVDERAEFKIECDCRKPKPGLLIRAAQKYNIDLSKSYMIGDTERDVEAGRAAGCTSLLVKAEYSLSNIVREILSK